MIEDLSNTSNIVYCSHLLSHGFVAEKSILREEIKKSDAENLNI